VTIDNSLSKNPEESLPFNVEEFEENVEKLPYIEVSILNS